MMASLKSYTWNPLDGFKQLPALFTYNTIAIHFFGHIFIWCVCMWTQFPFQDEPANAMTQLESCRKDRWCGEDRVVLLRVTVVECKTPSSSILNFTGGSSHGRPHRMSMLNDRMQKVSVLDLDLLSNQYIALLSLLPQPAISSIFCFLSQQLEVWASNSQPTI